MENEIYGVIYALRFPSGKYYIGQTIDFKTRMRSYKALRMSEQPKLHHAVVKYGWKNVNIEIICNCFDKEDLDAREKHCISIFDSIKNGYNSKEGGANGKFSEETRRKMRESQLKRAPCSEETRKKLSAANKGKIVSEETRRKISEKSKKLKHSEESKNRISEACKGKVKSRETLNKLRIANRTEERLLLNRAITEKLKDKNIYTIFKIYSKEKITGTRHEIFKLQLADKKFLESLFIERRNMCHGWILEKNNNEEFIKKLRINKGKVHIFENIKTKERLFLNCHKFSKHIKVKFEKVKKLINREIKILNDWTILDF